MDFLLLLKQTFFGRVESSFYIENRAALRSTNYGLLRKSCLFSTGMCLFLFCLTLVNSLIRDLSLFYLLYTLFFAAETVLVLTVVNRFKQLIPLFFYLFAAAIFILAIDIGTRHSMEIPAVTFHVFLLIIPILYVTRPVYSVLLSLAACAVFCVVTIKVKGAGTYLAQTDVLNAVCCCIVGFGLDTTIINLQLDHIRAKTHFKRQSATDELTGLPNRRRFDLYIDNIFQECVQSGENLFVLMMDIDDFKAFNDTYGHVKGDECLRRVGRALARTAQVHGVFLARFGGEEFVAVAARHGLGELRKIAGRLVEGVADLGIYHEKTPGGTITVSIGYADLHGTSAENCMRLLDCADEALYAAKASGKNRAVGWSEIGHGEKDG